MSGDQNQLCDPHLHLSRRSLLGAGAGGWMLSSIASRLALADALGESDAAQPFSVIVLWLEGGPSQLETFDPHPGTKIGGETTAIATSVPRLEIAHTLPRTAEQMHLASLIRSVTGKEGDHERAVYNIKTGYRPDPTLVHPSIGAVLCHASQGGADLPRHISIVPGQQPGRGGYLGPRYDAFQIADPAGPVPDVRKRVDEARYQRRITDLSNVVEEQFARGRLRDMERSRTLQATATDAALRMMSSEQLAAFDVSGEPREVRDAFGDTPFGRGCLAASRLIEVGVRCVEVTLGGWDSHVTNHSLQSAACETLDPALASLLQRLKTRDRLRSTLVVCGGEFGRTPSINAAAGRDHWPHGFSLLLAGANIRSGAVYGATSPRPSLDRHQPLADVSDPVGIEDVHATVLAALGLDFTEELMTPIGRPLRRSEGAPIRSLLL